MFECGRSESASRKPWSKSSTLRSPQYSEGRFANPQPPRDDMLEASMKWFRGAPNREPKGSVPVERPSARSFHAAENEFLFSWLGHSTVLLEIAGKRVLTDPVWSDRVSPFASFGPRRFYSPPLSLAELPEVDVVVISHDHYDHLDRDTVVTLGLRGSRFAVPLGVGERLREWGVPDAQVTELDWWQEVEVDGLRLVCTPARHFSGRGLLDRNRTLWAGWAILGPLHRVFFSGDSGMSPHFGEIGRRLGPFDLTMMDTGAYDSAWADVHMGPEQAVAAHRMVGGRLLLPVHWATFNLALHGWTEPGERVLVAATECGADLVLPVPGQRVHFDEPPEAARWWPEVSWNTSEVTPIVSSAFRSADDSRVMRSAS